MTAAHAEPRRMTAKQREEWRVRDDQCDVLVTKIQRNDAFCFLEVPCPEHGPRPDLAERAKATPVTAHHLRTAAAKLREVAESATPGPWTTSPSKYVSGAYVHQRRPNGRQVRHATEVTYDDATYIATMSPPVALAVAMWLETEATLLDNRMTEPTHDALAVANAVLADQDVAV